MILAILPDTAHTETLLNNLSEADFDLGQVSVVLRSHKEREAIAPDAGPLKGVSLEKLGGALERAGLSALEAAGYTHAVETGRVLVALIVPAESQAAAVEMLQDHSAEMIKE